MMSLVQYNGWWYVVVQEHGRARVYQLENDPPKVTWRDDPVINVTPGRTPVD
jgi:hypothetical protein